MHMFDARNSRPLLTAATIILFGAANTFVNCLESKRLYCPRGTRPVCIADPVIGPNDSASPPSLTPCPMGFRHNQKGECSPYPYASVARASEGAVPEINAPCPTGTRLDQHGRCRPNSEPGKSRGQTVHGNRNIQCNNCNVMIYEAGNTTAAPCPIGWDRDQDGQCAQPPLINSRTNATEQPCPTGSQRDHSGNCDAYPAELDDDELMSIFEPCPDGFRRDEEGCWTGPNGTWLSTYTDLRGPCPSGTRADPNGKCRQILL